MKLFGIDIDQLREDHLNNYVVLIRGAGLTQQCATARQKILTIMRHEYSAYQMFFSEQRLAEWKQWNNRQSLQTLMPITQRFLQPATKALGQIPANVQAVYQVIDTIDFVHDLALALEHVDLRPEKHLLTQSMQLILPLIVNLPKAYEQLHRLNDSSLYLQQLVAPSLEHLIQVIQQLFTQAETWKEMAMTAHAENREKFQHLFPEQTDGLAFLSRTIILSSYLLKELTELVERGDLTIDFNPASPEIIHLERRFNKAFKNIQHADALLQGLGPIGKIAELLYGEITKILQESVPLVRAGVLRADESVKKLKDEVLGHYRAEVETLEEQMGLMPGLLVEPFEVHRMRLIMALTLQVEQLSHLPETTDQLAKLTQQPITHAVMNLAVNTVQEGVMGIVRVVLPRQAAEPNGPEIDIDFHSEAYQALIHQRRLKRLAEHEHLGNSEDVLIAAMDFFKLINVYTTQWSGPRCVIDLPSASKQTLKRLYLPIQTYFARYSPRLDEAIVQGLNQHRFEEAVPIDPVERGYHFAFQWFQQQSPLLQVGLVLLLLNPQWCLDLSHRLLTHFFYRTLLLVALKQLWDYQQSELLQVAQAQSAVMIEIEQTRSQAQVTMRTLEKRLQAPLTEIQNQVEFQQEQQLVRDVVQHQKQQHIQAAHGELASLADSPRYQTVLRLIKTLQLSQKITTFEEQRLYPAFRQGLIAKQQRRLLDSKGMPLVPYEHVSQTHDALNLYQHVINGFYHLKIAMQKMEALSEEPAPGLWRVWQLINQPTQVLLPISNHGLAAYYELLALCQQPLVADIVKEGLAHVEQLTDAIPWMKTLIPAIQAAVTTQTTEVFDAYAIWVDEQNHYDALVQHQPLQEPVVVPEGEVEELPVSIPNQSPPFLLWFTAEAHRLTLLHQSLLTSTAVVLEQEQLERQALASITIFFEQLKAKSKEVLNKQKDIDPQPIDAFFSQIQTVLLDDGLSVTVQDTNNPVSIWNLFVQIKDTLRLLDQMSVIIKETYADHAEEAYQQLIAVRLVFSFRILAWADDLEYQLGIKTGRLSQLAKTYLDRFFEPFVALLSQNDQMMLAYFSDPTLLNLRVRRERVRLQQSQNAVDVHESGLDNNNVPEALPLPIRNDFDQLAQLMDVFTSGHVENLDELPDFKQFCNIYQRLQPHLANVNALVFTQKSFLACIRRHRPDHVVKAIQLILDHREKLNIHMMQQSDVLHDKTVASKNRWVTLNHIERKNQTNEAIEKAIKHLLHQLYYPVLGEYTDLYIKTATPQLIEDIQRQPNLLKTLQSNINNQAMDAFQTHLTKFIQNSLVRHQSGIGKLLQLLKKMHHFDERFTHQRQYAVNRYDQEKMDYSFVLKAEPFIPEEYKIYLECVNQKLFYEVLNPEGVLIRAEVAPAFLSTHHIDLTQGLDQNTLDKQLLPKLLPFVAMTTAEGHTQIKNPCLKEKMAYLGRLHQEHSNFARVKKELKKVALQEKSYSELYDEEVVRLQVLLAFREKKLQKMDRLVDLYEGLNELEQHCLRRPSRVNEQKIQLIKQLKTFLNDSNQLPQTRLNQVAWLLAQPAQQALLQQTRDKTWVGFFSAWLPGFMRWRVKEQQIVNQLLPVMGENYSILTTLMAWQHIGVSDSDIQRAKQIEIQHLVTIMQDATIGESVRLMKLTDYMVQTPCLAILMQDEMSWTDTFVVSQEVRFRSELFKRLGLFFELYYTLDQMQRYAEQEVLYKNDEKIQEIQALKNILASTDKTQEQRLHALYTRSISTDCQAIMTQSSDTCLMQWLKVLYTLLTGWKTREPHLQQQFQQQVSFFKPQRSLDDIIKLAKKDKPEPETPPPSNQP